MSEGSREASCFANWPWQIFLPWASNWYELRERCGWNAQFRSERSNRENGPTFSDFPLFLGIFRWDEPVKRFSFTTQPKLAEILTKWRAPSVSSLSWFLFQNYVVRNECPMNHFGSLAALKRLGTSLIAETSCFPSRLVFDVSLIGSLWVQKLIFKVRKNLMFHTVVKEGAELMLNAASLKYRSLFPQVIVKVTMIQINE